MPTNAQMSCTAHFEQRGNRISVRGSGGSGGGCCGGCGGSGISGPPAFRIGATNEMSFGGITYSLRL